MIQRKQTLFLAISLILLIAAYFFPIVKFEQVDKTTIMTWMHIHDAESSSIFLNTAPLIGTLIGSISFTLSTILLFKNRKLQMRLCVYSIVLLLGLTILTGYYSWKTHEVLTEANPNNLIQLHVQFSAILPIISAILNYLGFRNILKDELLIKSVDRLR